MKLIDLISVISEETHVLVWKDGKVASVYNGKDSIDEELNDCEVKSIFTVDKRIHVEL